MKITSVDLFELHGQRQAGEIPPGDRQAQALDIYPEFNVRDWARERRNGLQEIRAIYVEIQTDEAVSGLFGPIEDDQVFVIQKFLRPFLTGRDPLATELLSDQMLRMNRHGRSGMFMTGVSVIDCALWDLKGKAWGQPIYRLLGGPTRPAVPAYASMLGYSTEPEAAVRLALEFKQMGYSAQKWFFRFGPGDGEAGKAKNLALVRALRESLGEHYPIMADAFMGWDATYAAEMLQALAPYHLTWVEEPIPPEQLGAFARLRTTSGVPLASGEHVYTRWQVKELLEARALDWVQTDPDWCGGISELVKICALASSFDVPVAAHGHSLLAALHVAGSQSPGVVPYVEYLIQHQANKQHFHKQFYQPVNGTIALPELPGLGLVLDESKVERRVNL